jgi:molybdopterin synthase catalytic subunit
MRVSIQAQDFDVGAETAALLARVSGAGAVASFVGVVRSDAARPIQALTLEHYPAMTTRAVEKIAADAMARFSLLGCTVVHRHGRLAVGEQIVLVLAAATHRGPALDAVGFLMDWLKTAAPFWKQEHLADGSAAWVDARESDDFAARRWGVSQSR